jgi:hypothetical protein
MKFLVPIFILILSGFSGCSNWTIDFDQNFKDYVVYSPGSYWIYRDSANSSNVDSVALTSYTYGQIRVGDKGQDYQQTLSVTYYSTKDKSFTEYGVPGVYGNPYINITMNAISDTSTSIYFSFLDPFNGDILADGYVPYPNPMKIKNTVYTNVVEFRDTDPHSNKTVYWAKHVGIIKSVSRGIVWELDTCVVRQ